VRKRALKKLGNKGISTVFGSILVMILVLGLAAALFPSIYRYNYSVQEAIKVEEERMQEKIILCALATDNSSGTEYVSAIFVNNTGTITSRIRAIYIDNEFLCDPSDPSINPDDTYIDARESKWIAMPPGVEYDPAAKLTVATERGIKSSEYEGILKQGGQPPPYEAGRFYLGPLMLDFNKFYYTNASRDGYYDPWSWKPGWEIEVGTGPIVWNITVKNIDDRNITINQFSGFCLVPNDEPDNRRCWYFEPPPASFTKLIMSNETVHLIYIWDKPKKVSTNFAQSIYSAVCRNKVFLTFFGFFHEHDGTTKPYGQTIPFEAVLCVRTGGGIEISAWPTIILADSTMTSTITVKVYNVYGNPVANANVTFSTDLGTLSSLWAITDITGTATVTLYPSTLPGIATITATWEGLSQSTTVIINGIPVALFTESAETIYVGEEISFNASDSYDPDGSITSYFWDFGDGTNAMGVTANHTYIDDGVYTVTLTVTDDRGATASANAIKTVLNRPPIASFTESAETVLTGVTIYFDASGSYDPNGTIVSYFWNFGDGTNATGVTTSHSYADDGTYTVTLTVTDDDGVAGSTQATKTVLNRPSVASFTENATTVFTGEVIHFDASTSYDQDGSIVSYFWDFGDGTIGTGVAVDHSYADNGTYIVTLTVTDDDGATDAINATKYVLNRSPVASFTQSAETVSPGELISFDASASYDLDGTIVSYFWDFGDGTNATGVATSHSYINDGTYTVTLTITDDDGATASANATITVKSG